MSVGIIPPSPFRTSRKAKGFSFTPIKQIQIEEKSLGQHKYGCLMAVIPNPIRKQITDWVIENVPEYHRGKGGAEFDSHCTIKFGFKGPDGYTLSAIKEIMGQVGPFQIRLLGTSLFTSENKDGHVLKIDVESPQLRLLHQIMGERFPCEDKFANDYKPHITLSYLKPEYSQQYEALTLLPFCHQSVTINEVVWSGADGTRETIPLTILPKLNVGQKGMEGQPCTPGHTQYRDHCVPEVKNPTVKPSHLKKKEESNNATYYHGTWVPHTGFTKEKGTFYITTNEEYADSYRREGGDMLYIKLKPDAKIFDTRKPEDLEIARKLIENHHSMGYWGVDEFIKKKFKHGLPSWGATDFIEEVKKLGYDGMNINERYGEEVVESLAIFNPDSVTVKKKESQSPEKGIEVDTEGTGVSVEKAQELLHALFKRPWGDETKQNSVRWKYKLEKVRDSYGEKTYKFLILPKEPVEDDYKNVGAIEEIDEKPNMVYRGMSWEEWELLNRTGKIQSMGSHNFGGQENLTFYGSSQTGEVYANGFAPMAFKPTTTKPGIVIEIPKEHVFGHDENKNVPEGEYAHKGELSKDVIARVWKLVPRKIKSGYVEVVIDHRNQPSEGSRMSPSVFHDIVPFENFEMKDQKALSAYNETSGGALVPPPAFSLKKKKRKSMVDDWAEEIYQAYQTQGQTGAETKYDEITDKNKLKNWVGLALQEKFRKIVKERKANKHFRQIGLKGLITKTKDMAGQPCTPGHTEFRDHCVPTNQQSGRLQQIRRPKTKPGSYEFASLNIEEGLNYRTALTKLDSKEQKEFVKLSKEVFQAVGASADTNNAVGDWADGAENSLVTHTDITDPIKLAYAASWIGKIAKQKAVLTFIEAKDGPDSVFEAEVREKDLGTLRGELEALGIPFRSMVPTENGTKVIVFDQGTKLTDNLERLGEQYDTIIEQRKGTGEFIGADTREDAIKEYDKRIEQYEKEKPNQRRYRPRVNSDNGTAKPATVQEVERKVPSRAKQLLTKFAQLPVKVVKYAKTKAENLYARMSAKYGVGWARVILGVAILTMPTPFTMASVGATVGLAHLCTKYFGHDEVKSMTKIDPKIYGLADQMVKELTKEMEKEVPSKRGEKTFIFRKSGENLQGQPCTPGHNETRDGCIPKEKENGNESRSRVESTTNGVGPNDRGSDNTGVGGRVGETKKAKERIVIARDEFTKPGNPELVPEALRGHLRQHQIEAVSKAVDALDTYGGFILADGTGVGKTRSALATAKIYADQGRKVLIVAPKGVSKADWKKNTFSGSYLDDSKAMGIQVQLNKDQPLLPGQINLTTYEKLTSFEKEIDQNTLIIWDESHFSKNWQSARSKHAYKMNKAAGASMYMSATPIDKPIQLSYLFKAKVFGYGSWAETYREMGMIEEEVHTRHGTIKKWKINPQVGAAEVYRRLSGLFDKVTEEGLMIKREISFDGVDVGIENVPLPPDAYAMLDRIAEEVKTKVDNPGLQKALILMHQRRQLEPYKIAHTVEQAQKELKEGRQVIVFLSRVNESEVLGADVDEEGEQQVIASSEGTAKSIKEAFAKQGINCLELHGGAKEKPEKVMAAFQSGKGKVLIATVESGGTGINLDDTVGNAPRTMFMMTPPFSAMENVQAAGRIWRLNTKSNAKIRYTFTDIDVDRWNASILATKFSSLGATVQGQLEKLNVIAPEGLNLEEAIGERKENRYRWQRTLVQRREERRAENKPVQPKQEVKPSVMVELTGNTYEHREAIKAAGGRWNPEKKVWAVPQTSLERVSNLNGVRVSNGTEKEKPKEPQKPIEFPVNKMSVEKKEAIHRALRQLAGNDTDRARERNNVGFNQMDSRFGGNLAELPELSDKQAEAAATMLLKYRRQLGDGLIEQITKKEENEVPQVENPNFYAVSGNTFKNKEAIKAVGGRWDAARVAWIIPAKGKEKLESLRGLVFVGGKSLSPFRVMGIKVQTKSLIFRKDGANLEGQPCTPGHTEFRDHCIPDEEGGKTSNGGGSNQSTQTHGRLNVKVPKVKRGRLRLKEVTKEYMKLGTKAPKFKEWFGDWENDPQNASKVVDEEGKPLVMYHGTRRADRVKDKFDPKRATSGPMAFFTSDKEIASKYAEGKKDTSLERPDDYSGWFKVKLPGFRSMVTIDRLWFFLPYEVKQNMAKLAPRVATDENVEGGLVLMGEDHETGIGNYDYEIKNYRGNVLKTLVESWLNSGALFGDEEKFLKVLEMAGLNMPVIYDDPEKNAGGVYSVYLNIRNPLNTAVIPDEVYAKLHEAGKRKRGKPGTGADFWDKRHISGRDWLIALEEDKKEGTSLVWTRIPDWVTQTLRQMGYDGVQDTGGKYHPDKHQVWIPFSPEQVKSTANQGSFDPSSVKMSKGLEKKAKSFTPDVGSTVIWQSKIGPVQAEYRGKLYGMDGYEATIIVREEDKPPFQITVPMDQIKEKGLQTKQKTYGGTIQEYRGWKIERVEEATNVGYRNSTPRRNPSDFNDIRIVQHTRKVSGYLLHYPEGHGDNPRWCNTLKEAKQYVDNYEGTDNKSLLISPFRSKRLTIQSKDKMTESKTKRYYSYKKSSLLSINQKNGFTGKKEDSRGATICYQQGVRVPCEQIGETNNEEPKQDNEIDENAQQKKPQTQQEATEALRDWISEYTKLGLEFDESQMNEKEIAAWDAAYQNDELQGSVPEPPGYQERLKERGIDTNELDEDAGKENQGQEQSQTKEKQFAPPPEGETIVPPECCLYDPDPTEINPDTGVAEYSRVGVPAMSVPPPPNQIPRLPNLTEKERKAESNFADAFLADPDGMVNAYEKARNTVVTDDKGNKKYLIGDGPNVFNMDDVKTLSHDYNPQGASAQDAKISRGLYNAMVHQTANAIAKRGFVQYLDKLPDDKKNVLVTSGGCASGKTYGLSNVNETKDLVSKAGAVWDAAGEQNATENPWILEECRKRGIRPTFVFVWANPKDRWDNPKSGVIERAGKQGRMVDSKLYADSYALGAKNFKAFYDKNKDSGDCDFVILDNSKGNPQLVKEMPQEALEIDGDELYATSVRAIKERGDTLNEGVRRGGTVGERIWGEPTTKEPNRG